jgi:hypothetical protein
MPWPWEKSESLENLQETEQRRSVELSIAEKEAVIARLRKEGLSLKKSFGGSLSAAWNWFRSH